MKYQYSKHAQSPRELANYEGFRPSKWRQVQSSAPPKGSTSPSPSELPKTSPNPTIPTPPLENIPRQLNSFPSACPTKGNGGALDVLDNGAGWVLPTTKAGIMQCSLVRAACQCGRLLHVAPWRLQSDHCTLCAKCGQGQRALTVTICWILS